VRQRSGDEAHEVARSHFYALLADLGDAAARQDVNPLLVVMVEVEHAAAPPLLQPHEMNAYRVEPDRIAQRARVPDRFGIQRMHARIFRNGFDVLCAQQGMRSTVRRHGASDI